MTSILTDASGGMPITAITADHLATWLRAQPAQVRTWVEANGFKADSGAALVLAGGDGAVSSVLLGLGKGDDPWSTGNLSKILPKGHYRIAEASGLAPGNQFATWAALAWGL